MSKDYLEIPRKKRDEINAKVLSILADAGLKVKDLYFWEIEWSKYCTANLYENIERQRKLIQDKPLKDLI